MNKYEKLIEYIISEQEDRARELFHEIVVEKSRDIYESLVEADDEMGGDEVDDLIADIEADEDGIAEAEHNDIALDEVDMEMDADEADMDADEDEMDADEVDMEMDADEADMDADEDDEEIEDRVEDLESALDELKAEFDALMAKEQDDSDMDMDMDMDADQGDADMVREYVEKVSAPANAEGHEAAAGGSVAVNKKSSVARKNDMGGTTANTVRGGSEANPDGVKPKSADNYGTKARGNLPHAGKYENVPGAKTKGYVNKRDAKKGEESGVNTKSVESGK